jgi:hypothetical protein
MLFRVVQSANDFFDPTRSNGVLNRKAESAKDNPVSARDEIALVHKKNGSYRRRGPANTKWRGVGIGDGVLQAEESRRCTRFLACGWRIDTEAVKRRDSRNALR